MSAFIVNDRHIDYLVSAGMKWGIVWLAPSETPADVYQRGAPWGPGSVENVKRRSRKITSKADAEKAGAMLSATNRESVNHRYNENEIEEMYSFRRVFELEAVQVIKALDCYEYQSCEHPEWEASEALNFCNALRSMAGHKIPGYDDAQWEIRPR